MLLLCAPFQTDCGRFCSEGDFAKLVRNVKKIIENINLRDFMGRNGRRYFEKNNSIGKVVEKPKPVKSVKKVEDKNDE